MTSESGGGGVAAPAPKWNHSW